MRRTLLTATIAFVATFALTAPAFAEDEVVKGIRHDNREVDKGVEHDAKEVDKGVKHDDAERHKGDKHVDKEAKKHL